MPQSSRPPIRVLVADDHAVVREGIRQVLSADEGFEVIGEAADGDQAVALAEALRPDVVVLDLTMPSVSGFEAAALIHDRVPDARILVLSIHDHEEYVLQSVRAGTRGYLRKDSSPAELRSAVRTVYDGGTFFSPPVLDALSSAVRNERLERARSARLASLTARERDVLTEIARGRTNKGIAGHLRISVRTVESHREALMRKLGVRGVASLTRLALDEGLLPGEQSSAR